MSSVLNGTPDKVGILGNGTDTGCIYTNNIQSYHFFSVLRAFSWPDAVICACDSWTRKAEVV